MKKWMIPVLAIILVGATFPAPSQAWPWSKKPKPQQAVTKTTPKESPAEKQSAPPQNTQSQASDVSTSQEQDSSSSPKVEVQSPLSDELNTNSDLKVENPIESKNLPPDKTYVAVDDPKNPLGITVSAEKLNNSAQYIAQGKYKDAEKILNPLKTWLISATETHINLHNSLKDISSAQVQAELEKQLALQFALLRDKAIFQLGMVAVGQKDYPTAIKNLSMVIQSQPDSEMGAEAYNVLQKIGFTEKLQLRGEKKSSQKS